MNRLVVAILIATTLCAVAACDSLPITELRNGARQTIVVRSVMVTHVVTVERGGDAEVPPKRKLRFLHAPQSLALNTAGCDLIYDLPGKDLSNSMGAVNRLEVGADLRIYLGRGPRGDGSYGRLDSDKQPAGWPVAPSSKACR